jgi:hypothetical protein
VERPEMAGRSRRKVKGKVISTNGRRIHRCKDDAWVIVVGVLLVVVGVMFDGYGVVG